MQYPYPYLCPYFSYCSFCRNELQCQKCGNISVAVMHTLINVIFHWCIEISLPFYSCSKYDFKADGFQIRKHCFKTYFLRQMTCFYIIISRVFYLFLRSFEIEILAPNELFLTWSFQKWISNCTFRYLLVMPIPRHSSACKLCKFVNIIDVYLCNSCLLTGHLCESLTKIMCHHFPSLCSYCDDYHHHFTVIIVVVKLMVIFLLIFILYVWGMYGELSLLTFPFA